MWLILLGVRTQQSMVVDNNDAEVNNVISETSFGCLKIVKIVDHLIYLSKSDIKE
jgi:hypothetical protein